MTQHDLDTETIVKAMDSKNYPDGKYKCEPIQGLGNIYIQVIKGEAKPITKEEFDKC